MTVWQTILLHPPVTRRPPSERLAGAPWLALCVPGAVQLRDPSSSELRALPPGSAVVLVSDRPLSRRRLRASARRAGVVVERELIVLPSTAHPVAAVDDTGSAVRHFWQAVAAVPPGLALSAAPAALGLRLARAVPWRWTGAVAPGRVLIGRRT
ncbi:MAG: hypothetical protein ACRDPB_10340 [Nocardioidaceae bacterium]